MKDLKYLAAYIAPVLAILGLIWQGWWTYAVVIYAFIFIPIAEPFLPKSEENFSESEKGDRLKTSFFDWLLYLNLPLLYVIIFLFVYAISQGQLETYELIGSLLSISSIIAASGINVGHELGHRKRLYERRLAKMHLLPALYMHFYIEHNRGHHKFVATPLDPASADKGENVYGFMIKSLVGGFKNAWKLEKKRMIAKGKPVISLHNEMIRFQLIQLAYLGVIASFFGWFAMLMAALAGISGALQLEVINYVEHYGLRRKLLPSGKYERVNPKHSWNANYELGRIVLYELTRHSDHHYMASKKYQVLDHHDESPELPYGYPASMILSLVPPLWFKVMHKELEKYKEKELVVA